ncbi:MAG: MerR family transcriptional regulator [Gammaproteobacteria bacterium]|nr:MerR family transcriptional regulator [Gammaproteobacteria bacterium]
MFSIGDFSLLARVPYRALLAWQAHGLLRPRLHEADGNQYYGADHLPQVNRIVVLRELGFCLRDIKRMVDDVPPAGLRGMLRMRRCAANQLGTAEAAADQLYRLRLIESRIAQLENQQPLCPDEVQLRAEPAQLLLCARETVTSFAKLRSLLCSVAVGVRSSVPAPLLGKFMVVLHAREFELREPRRAGRLRDTGVVCGGSAASGWSGTTRRATPRRRAACQLRAYWTCGTRAPHHCAPRTIHRSHDYCLAGAGREVFSEPGRLGAPELTRIEMQFPIIKARQAREVAGAPVIRCADSSVA